MMMDISGLGRKILEGREGVRLEAYRDTRGIWTIGVGHTAAAGRPFPRAGMMISRAEVDAIFRADLAPGVALLDGLGLRLTQCQFDALCSLGFNIGWSALAHSTVVRKLGEGDVAGAADAFLMWDHPPELKGRREQERVQFLTPDQGQAFPSAPLSLDPETTKGVQRALNAIGAGLVEDGDLGPMTRTALVAALAVTELAHV